MVKKFIWKVLIFLVITLAIIVVPSIIVDPYNVFHYDNIRNNGVEPNKNYIKTKYIINNPNKYDGFLLGSSRIGSIHVEKIKDYCLYNMTYSEGTPQEHLATLRTFLDKGVSVDVVYMGIDSLSYTADPSQHINSTVRCPYQYMINDPKKLFELYFNPYLVVKSIQYLGNEIDGYDAFYDYGWWCDYDRSTTYDWSRAIPSIGLDNRLDETLQEIQEIIDLCNEYNIKLVIFTNPMYKITYGASVERDYLVFLSRLADITDYYNFSGINEITINTENYIDANHYNAYVGDMLIDVMFNGSVDESLYNQGFGWYVTSENVDDLLSILRGNVIIE